MRVKFYLKASGRSPIEEFLSECSQELKSDFFDAVNLLTQGQNLAMPLSKNLSSIQHGLHEMRLKDRSGQVRVFYYVKKGDAIYLLHAFKKKTQELSRKEIDIALSRIKEI